MPQKWNEFWVYFANVMLSVQTRTNALPNIYKRCIYEMTLCYRSIHRNVLPWLPMKILHLLNRMRMFCHRSIIFQLVPALWIYSSCGVWSGRMHTSIQASVSYTAKLHVNNARERRCPARSSVISSQLVPKMPEEFGKYGKAGNRKRRGRFWQGPNTRQKCVVCVVTGIPKDANRGLEA